MQFIINGMKYNTDKMEKMADVKKWYQIDNLFMQAAYPDKKLEDITIANYGKVKKEIGF